MTAVLASAQKRSAMPMDASRPRVLLNFASSVDGKIAPSPGSRDGYATMSSHAEDHRRMRELRGQADAILIGAGNLRADDPDLALGADERERRRSAGRKEPIRIVVTRQGDGVEATCKMFDPAHGGRSFVVHSQSLPPVKREELSPVTTLIEMGEFGVDTLRMLAWLARNEGVGVLLCEGGGIIAGELFRARAVDQLFLTLVPRVLGGSDAPTLAGGPSLWPEARAEASLGAVDRVGDELFLRYDFRW
jgi:riboflavin-specific deaminase-like protein